MSASMLVDLGNTCLMGFSQPGASGIVNACSGVSIGLSVDLLNANSFCNLVVAGRPSISGDITLQVQCSDFDTSGSFVDPTSGLAQMPTVFTSGGIVSIQSGGVFGAFVSGQSPFSGFIAGAGFQRPFRYARVNVLSGNYVGPLVAGFISQLKTVGSGGGFSFLPGSGTVNV